MKCSPSRIAGLVITFVSAAAVAQTPLGTEFTYQGFFKQNGTPYTGTADLIFRLWDDPTNEEPSHFVGGQFVTAVQMTNGLFSVPLNANGEFGPAAFNGQARWLEVSAAVPDASAGYVALTPRQPVSSAPYALQTRGLAVDDLGQVGVGTSYPAARLHIAANSSVNDLPLLTLAEDPADESFSFRGDFLGGGATGNLLRLRSLWNSTVMAWRGDGNVGVGTASPSNKLTVAGSADVTGNVGIGTNAPLAPLHVVTPGLQAARIEGTSTFGTWFNLYNTTAPNRFWRLLATGTGNGEGAGKLLINTGTGPGSSALTLMTFDPAGNIGVGTTTPSQKLDVNGTTRTKVLEITGGSDIAEPFNINGAQPVEPGMVVAIDASCPGELRLADRPYDPTVAGIISGAGGVGTGLTLQQPGTLADGKHPVALTGRVWCYCDADAGGAIQPGDFLTTSDTPGHAMKATDRDRAFGCTIGKAMTGLESGNGLVLVLVSLQ